MLVYVKGLVHFKMKILSFTHPQVVSILWISFFCWTQKKIFWRMSVTKLLMGPIRGVRKNWYSWVSRYFIVQYCIDFQKHNIFFFCGYAHKRCARRTTSL